MTKQTIDGVLVSRELLELAWLELEDRWSWAGELRALLDAPAVEARDKCGVQMVDCPECSHQWDHFFGCGNKPAAQPQGEPVACAHDWTDDGEYLIVCTKCGAQEDHDPGWLDMAKAPTDGTMVRLLVEFEEHSTEDAQQAPTIGANNFDNDGEDVWRFAGWCWSHDHFTEGKGVPVGWLPMLDGAKLIPAAEQPAPVACPGDGVNPCKKCKCVRHS